MWSQRCEKCLQGCAGVVVNTFINGTLNANEPAEVTSWEVQSYEENLIGNFIKFWHCQAGSFATSPDWMSGAVVHFFPPNCFIGQHLTISPFDWTHFDGKHLLWFWYFSKYQGIVTIISKWRKKKLIIQSNQLQKVYTSTGRPGRQNIHKTSDKWLRAVIFQRYWNSPSINRKYFARIPIDECLR